MGFISYYIEEEAKKHIERYHKYHNFIELEYQRDLKRLVSVPSKEIKIPDCWNSDNKFNPFYVLKHRKQISYSIEKKLKNYTYEPAKPYIREIPKPSGGVRKISIYQIPDAAVSSYIYYRLLSKYKHRFSSLSYAYRNDRNVHFAIEDISLDFKQYPRLYIAEFDFKDFFGSIDHDYLSKQWDENGFSFNKYEKSIITSFININEKGIPQGTSISLFLANMACWKLDRKLEAEGLRFARYADDTLIWSQDYSKICKAFELIYNFSNNAGLPINFDKSNGIRLLIRDGMSSEFNESKTTTYVDFLGYKIYLDKVAIKDKSVHKIKKQISYLLYKNLIQPLKSPTLKSLVVPNNSEDRDFVTSIMQIRRYLYGNLNETKLKGYLNGKFKRLYFKGLMSFYPLLDDIEQLIELDSWLINTIYNCIKLRDKLFINRGINVSGQFPFNLSRDNIVDKCKNQPYKGSVGLMEIPSFLRIYKTIKQGVINQGIEQTMNPRSNYYFYF